MEETNPASLASVCVCVCRRGKKPGLAGITQSFMCQLVEVNWNRKDAFLIPSKTAFSSGIFFYYYTLRLSNSYTYISLKSYPMRTEISIHTTKIKSINMPDCLFASYITATLWTFFFSLVHLGCASYIVVTYVCVKGEAARFFFLKCSMSSKTSHLLCMRRVGDGCICCTNSHPLNLSCFFLRPPAQTFCVRMKKAIGVVHLMLVLVFSLRSEGTSKAFSVKPSVGSVIQLFQGFWFPLHVHRPSGQAHAHTMSLSWKRDLHLLVETRLRWGLAHHLCLVLPQREVSDQWFGVAVHFLHFSLFGLDCCSFKVSRWNKGPKALQSFITEMSIHSISIMSEETKKKKQRKAWAWYKSFFLWKGWTHLQYLGYFWNNIHTRAWTGL